MATATRKPPPLRRGGYYWLEDPKTGVVRPLVSVTEVLNEVAKQNFFVPAAIKKAHAAWSENPNMDVKQAQATWYQSSGAKADIGSLLHSVYEAHQRGAPMTPDQLPDEATRNHFKAFLQWFADVSPKMWQVEATVANFTYGYAGTGDLWAEIGALLAIVDYKTGFLDLFSCAMQESAYENGEVGFDKAENKYFDLPKVEARFALQTKDNGTYRFEKLPDRFPDFLAYLHVWRARRREEGKDEPCPAACFCQSVEVQDDTFVTVCRECASPQGTPHLSDCSRSVFRAFDGP